MNTLTCNECRVTMIPDLTDVEGLRQHCPRCMIEGTLGEPSFYRCSCGNVWAENSATELRQCPECGLAGQEIDPNTGDRL
jgi:Zn ribbon nucleic-acid-binding protein